VAALVYHLGGGELAVEEIQEHGTAVANGCALPVVLRASSAAELAVNASCVTEQKGDSTCRTIAPAM
jgi:hypothetical protein